MRSPKLLQNIYVIFFICALSLTIASASCETCCKFGNLENKCKTAYINDHSEYVPGICCGYAFNNLNKEVARCCPRDNQCRVSNNQFVCLQTSSFRPPDGPDTTVSSGKYDPTVSSGTVIWVLILCIIGFILIAALCTCIIRRGCACVRDVVCFPFHLMGLYRPSPQPPPVSTNPPPLSPLPDESRVGEEDEFVHNMRNRNTTERGGNLPFHPDYRIEMTHQNIYGNDESTNFNNLINQQAYTPSHQLPPPSPVNLPDLPHPQYPIDTNYPYFLNQSQPIIPYVASAIDSTRYPDNNNLNTSSNTPYYNAASTQPAKPSKSSQPSQLANSTPIITSPHSPNQPHNLSKPHSVQAQSYGSYRSNYDENDGKYNTDEYALTEPVVPMRPLPPHSSRLNEDQIIHNLESLPPPPAYERNPSQSTRQATESAVLPPPVYQRGDSIIPSAPLLDSIYIRPENNDNDNTATTTSTAPKNTSTSTTTTTATTTDNKPANNPKDKHKNDNAKKQIRTLKDLRAEQQKGKK